MLKVLPNVTIENGGQLTKYKNNVVQLGLDWILDLVAAVNPAALSYIAIGADGTQVSLGDAQLKDERYRKQITSITRGSASTVIELYIDKPEAIFYWKEIGLFAGGDGTPNSGKLIARAIVDEQKDNKRTATITWEVGIQNA